MKKEGIRKLFPPSALDGVFPNSQAAKGSPARLHHSSRPAPDTRRVYRVSELLDRISRTLDTEYGPVWIEGEISDFTRAPSGHCYFTLKDESGYIKCVMFRNAARKCGIKIDKCQHIKCHGRLNIYIARGDLQLVADMVEPAGEGALYARFEKLKRRLEAQGIFDESGKKKCPDFPDMIFVVTSPGGAAVRDFIKTVSQRWRGAAITVVPTLVQGKEAAPEIVRALALADDRAGENDVIVLTRGGGSLEDLWAFNEEIVARAVAATGTPVVSAIGHERDFTLADFAADHRSATPTAAAADVTPDAASLLHATAVLKARCARAAMNIIQGKAHGLELLEHRLRHPASLIAEQRQMVDSLEVRLLHAAGQYTGNRKACVREVATRLRLSSPATGLPVRRTRLIAAAHGLLKGIGFTISNRRSQLENSAARLDAVSPLGILARGYSLVINEKTDEITRDARQVSKGDRLLIRPARGTIRCGVTEISGGD